MATRNDIYTLKRRKVTYVIPDLPTSPTHIPRGERSENAREYVESQDLVFQIADWYSEDAVVDTFTSDEEEDDDPWEPLSEYREYTIHVYGVNMNGHSITCNITGFNPYFFVKVPNNWSNEKCAEFVKHNITHDFRNVKTYDKETQDHSIEKKLVHRNYNIQSRDSPDERIWVSFSSALIDWKIVMRYDLDAGFTGVPPKLFKFIKLQFKTLTALKYCYWNLRKKKDLHNGIYEANIEPQTRCMHIKEILAAGWIKIPANQYSIITNEDRISSTQLEVTTMWTEIEPLNINDIANFRQASFDIECFSGDRDKMPVPENPDNPIIQIGTVIQDYKNPDKFIKHIITLKKCNPIKDTIVICCETEKELLLTWRQLLEESDPDIIYGYNIFGFDLNYLMVRAEYLKCEEFKYLGRMKFIPSFIEDKAFSSSAHGDNFFKMVPMPGRLQIDLLQVMLRGMTKYPSYRLGYISQAILSTPLPANPLQCVINETQIFVNHPNHKFARGAVVNLFNVDALGGYTYDEINTMHVIGEVIYNDQNETTGYYINMKAPATCTETGGGDNDPRAFETKHDLQPHELFAKFSEGSPENITEIAEYCVQDCMLPQKIINKCNILLNTIEMAKVTYVPISTLITRGQQIKVFSQLSKVAREHNYLIPTIEHDKNAPVKKKFKGATVLAPSTGAYWDGVACLDFKALYPTIEIDWNLCYSTIVKDKRYANLPEYKYFSKTIDGVTYTFSQSIKGIVPIILERLLNARDDAKVEMKNAPTPFAKAVADGKQLAFKVSCNSVYGFTGSGDTGIFPCKAIARTTTAIGRGMIEISKEFSEDINNFKEVTTCVDYFPIDYIYLCLFKNGKRGLMTFAQLIDMYGVEIQQLYKMRTIELNQEDIKLKPVSIWTSDEFQQIRRFSCKQEPYGNNDRWLFRVDAVKGKILDMQKYKCHAIYGDSITSDTPVMLKNEAGRIMIRTIGSFDMDWQEYPQFKPGDTDRYAKEQLIPDTPLYVWARGVTSPTGKWAKIKRIIRHKTNKLIYRVTTGIGCVDVTEDHSLLTSQGNIIKPKHCKIADALYSSYPPQTTSHISTLNAKFQYRDIENKNNKKQHTAFLYGVIFANHCCRQYTEKEITILARHPSKTYLEKCKTILKTRFKYSRFRIDNDDTQYVLQYKTNDLNEIRKSDIYSKCFNSNHEVFIPNEIVNGSFDTKMCFLHGLYLSFDDYYTRDVLDYNSFNIKIKGKLKSAQLFYLFKDVGYNCIIKAHSTETDICQLTTNTAVFNTPTDNTIKNIECIGTSNYDFVYDLETEEGTFNAGIGELILKNTDSEFTKFDTSHLSQNCHKLAYSMTTGAYVANKITHKLRSINQFKPIDEQWTELEYEKVYLELFLFSKKRYAGSLYETNPYKKSYIDKKGIAMKRRDFCKFVHEVFKNVLECLFNNKEPKIAKRITRAKQIFIASCDDLLDNKISLSKLILSKLLKGKYKIRDQTVTNSFNSFNIFKGDIICWKSQKYGICKGIVKKKTQKNTQSYFKKNTNNVSNLSVLITHIAERKLKSSVQKLCNVDYTDITFKEGYEMTLSKIMDPSTDEKMLEKVTQPHVRLARRMCILDPGNAPSSGTRLRFIFVESNNKKAKQYEKTEHVDYVKAKNLKPDPIYYYEHQLKKPLFQLFELFMDNPESLVEESLRRYKNKQNKQREITSFFFKK